MQNNEIEIKQIEELKQIDELKKEDINFHISIIKMSLLNIKKLCKNQQEAYLYKDVIINLTENILFFFFNC
jgi:hypothetical protein